MLRAKGGSAAPGGTGRGADRGDHWLRRWFGGVRPAPPAIRLYRLGERHTALPAIPANLFDPDHGLDPTNLPIALVVDPGGQPRASGARPQPGDGVLLATEPSEIAVRIKANPQPLGEPLLFDLRDRSGIVAGIRVRVAPGSFLAGRSLSDMRFRQRYWAVVTALWQQGQPIERRFSEYPLAPGDEFVALGRRKRVEELTRLADLDVVVFGRPEDAGIDQQIVALSVPGDSPLVGASLRSGSLDGLVELSIVGIRRRGEPRLAISQEDPIRPGDPLLAVGEPFQVLSLLQRGLVAAEEEVGAGPS